MAVATKRASKTVNYERVLRAKRDEIQSQLRGSRDDMVSERVPDDQWGLASQTLLEDLAVGTIQRQQQLLTEVESALKRVEDGSFGECDGCGESISARRLQALPWARYCLKCAELRHAVLMN
jgi:DnaK suppressor protein